MITATSTWHRTANSWAFLNRPALRLINVLFLNVSKEQDWIRQCWYKCTHTLSCSSRQWLVQWRFSVFPWLLVFVFGLAMYSCIAQVSKNNNSFIVDFQRKASVFSGEKKASRGKAYFFLAVSMRYPPNGWRVTIIVVHGCIITHSTTLRGGEGKMWGV